ncbi:MAG: multidrug effflux MFS transporter [Beijerinckiaceae bacterium]
MAKRIAAPYVRRLDFGKPIPYRAAMQLRPGTFGMTALLAMLTALGPLSTDLYLPSLPSMARGFGTDLSRVQLTLSVFIFGFAIGQIFYGPISDKFGRRPVILFGLGLYCIGAAICAIAPTAETLIAARLVQAIGACGPIVLGRAIVRDVYEGAQAAKELSRMGMLMGLVPAVAPLIGGVMEPLFGWRANFILLVTGGAALTAAVILLLPETIRERRPEPLSLASVFANFGAVLRNPSFRVYAGMNSLTFAGLFGFISGSSFVLQGAYGFSPMAFAVAFSIMCVGFIGGTVVTQAIVGRLGTAGTIRLGSICLAAGGIAMLAAMAAGLGAEAAVIAPMTVYAFGVGLVMPATNASAMMPFGNRAGSASSLLGVLQSTFAAATAALTGVYLDGRPLLMAAVIATAGLAAAALALTQLRTRP